MSILEHIPGTDLRIARQLRLEDLIVRFSPDPSEAAEIIMAVLKRFKDDEEISTYAQALYKSLDRYELRCAEVDEIDAFKDWRARNEL